MANCEITSSMDSAIRPDRVTKYFHSNGGVRAAMGAFREEPPKAEVKSSNPMSPELKAAVDQARIDRLLADKGRKHLAAERFVDPRSILAEGGIDFGAIRPDATFVHGEVVVTGIDQTIPVAPGQVVYGTKDLWIGVPTSKR